jgi:signal transduction histidine kinase
MPETEATDGESRSHEELAMQLPIALQRAEERCRALESQLRQSQKLQALGTLASGIAHDFNNLLTVIGGHAELALSESQRQPVRDSLNEIKDAVSSARDLVRRLLVFSRRQESDRKPVLLRPIVDDAVKLLRAMIPKTITVGVRAARDLPMICADPTAIQQVVMNLGTNAAHAMREAGGRLTMTIDSVRMEAGAVNAARLVPGSYVRLTVRDHGTGISPEIMDQIFDPFFSTKGDDGTGLGLAIVNGIMRELHGAVTVTSEPGRGTTFCLLFPEATPPVDSLAVAPDLPARGSGQLIMYVDDEPSLGRLMTRILESLGYQCTAFSDAGRALEAFRAAPDSYAAAMIDISKPGMSRAVLAGALTDIRANLPIAIIGESGEIPSPQPGQVRLYLQKPVPMFELGKALRQLTGGEGG